MKQASRVLTLFGAVALGCGGAVHAQIAAVPEPQVAVAGAEQDEEDAAGGQLIRDLRATW